MTDIKLIAIDIDGTLVNSKSELTPETIAAIKEAKSRGIKVVLCTGRPLSGAEALLEQLDLDHAADQYLVCFGGAAVKTTAGQVIYERGISYEDFVDLEGIARKLNIHFQAISSDRIYTCNKDIGKYTLYEANLVNLGISYRTPEEMRGIELIKAMYIEDAEILDPAIAHRELFEKIGSRLDLMKTAPFYYEAYAKGVNKGAALDKLCGILKISRDQVLALGDEENDLSMIKFAKLGVAMGNATAQVKAAAEEITADNDHDGVALAIRKFAL